LTPFILNYQEIIEGNKKGGGERHLNPITKVIRSGVKI